VIKKWTAKRVALALAFSFAGCSGSTPVSTDTTVTSESGALRVELRVSATQRGTNSAVLTVTNIADSTPRDGLSIGMRPWMPSMNHGSSTPTVTPQGSGHYQVSQLYLYMPGHWELQTTLSGPVSDHVSLAVEVP
jgi:hypothetical protein